MFKREYIGWVRMRYENAERYTTNVTESAEQNIIVSTGKSIRKR